MSNLIDFECPHCHGGFKFERSEFQARQIAGGYALGQLVPCPHCQGEVTVCLPLDPPIAKRQNHRWRVFSVIGLVVVTLLVVVIVKFGISAPSLTRAQSEALGEGGGAIILICIGAVFYFIPSFVAHNKKNSTAIFLLNLFLGWTFLGWVVALVWANMKDE